jgi:hypothetical protein
MFRMSYRFPANFIDSFGNPKRILVLSCRIFEGWVFYFCFTDLINAFGRTAWK